MKILYEDNHMIVVLKPQNVPSQPDESGDVDMLTMVKDYIKTSKNKPGEAFVGLVHRLDRPTGGVMVFALTSKGASRLSEQMKNKTMTKKYLAVVAGVPKNQREILTHYLRKNGKQNMVEVVPYATDGAKLSQLEYKVLASNRQASLVEVELHTGRSHQIRAQFSTIGHPLYGDHKYGSKLGTGKNLALWAYELKLEHPTTKVSHTFRVLPPKDELPWKVFENLPVFNS